MGEAPYKCRIRGTDTFFTAKTIDYENEMVWKKEQSSDRGAWLDFDDVKFYKVEGFKELEKR